MNKHFSSILFSCFTPIMLAAQNDVQTSILTDDGIITISKTIGGKDMILLRTGLWDDMVNGTKYTSVNLHPVKETAIYIEISNKRQMRCKAGVGFRCGIFDRVAEPIRNPGIIDHNNRLCAAILQKQDRFTIKIIFLDEVNWYNLQTDRKILYNEKNTINRYSFCIECMYICTCTAIQHGRIHDDQAFTGYHGKLCNHKFIKRDH